MELRLQQAKHSIRELVTASSIGLSSNVIEDFEKHARSTQSKISENPKSHIEL